MQEIHPGTVLFVCPHTLYPVNGGGAARTWAMIDFLRAQGFRVELVCKTHSKNIRKEMLARVDALWYEQMPIHADKEQPASQSIYRRIIKWMRPSHPEKSIKQPNEKWRDGGNVFPNHPHDALVYDKFKTKISRQFVQFARETALHIRPVAVIGSFVWSAPALRNLPKNITTIIDTVDLQHLRSQKAVTAGFSANHLGCSREEESMLLSDADAIIAIETSEAKELNRMCPNTPVILVEHGFSMGKACHTPPTSRSVLFVGNLYEPNRIGLECFLRDVWPAIFRDVPESELIICGRICDAFRGDPIAGVRFEGVVPDLFDYYDNAAVVVNPVPYGTGLKIKSVEALIHGKALVTTSAGVEGILMEESVKDGPCVMAEMTQMASRIVYLLTHPEERMMLEKRAYDYARERFSPDRIYASLLEIVSRPMKHGNPIQVKEPCSDR